MFDHLNGFDLFVILGTLAFNVISIGCLYSTYWMKRSIDDDREASFMLQRIVEAKIVSLNEESFKLRTILVEMQDMSDDLDEKLDVPTPGKPEILPYNQYRINGSPSRSQIQ